MYSYHSSAIHLHKGEIIFRFFYGFQSFSLSFNWNVIFSLAANKKNPNHIKRRSLLEGHCTVSRLPLMMVTALMKAL